MTQVKYNRIEEDEDCLVYYQDNTVVDKRKILKVKDLWQIINYNIESGNLSLDSKVKISSIANSYIIGGVNVNENILCLRIWDLINDISL